MLCGGEFVFQIDLKSRKPIYEQVIDNFKLLIITGTLQENEKVPSIRDLAKTLTVTPNTVQKAYKELELQGYFYTILGQGNFISKPPIQIDTKKRDLLYNQMQQLVQELNFMKEPEERIINFIKNIYIDLGR